MSFLFRDYWRYMPTRLKMMLFWLRKAAKRRLADDQSPGDDNLSPKVLLDLEKHFSKAKDGSETVSDWQAVLDMSGNPTPAGLYARLSRALRKQGNFDSAEAVIRQGMSAHPDDSTLAQDFAQLAMVQQDWPVAVKRWQEILETFRDESLRVAYPNLSRAYIKLDDLDAAYSIVRKGVLMFPGDLNVAKPFGSLQRTRVCALYMDRFVDLRPGMRILHLAPEPHIFYRIAQVVGDNYDPRDLNTERFQFLRYGNIRVRKLDLCTDAHSLPKNHYDLILHNHVIEHLPCNYTTALYHLHHSLAENGLHMFTLPISDGSYKEDWDDLPSKERKRRFGNATHMRLFGREDIERTIGMIFDIKDQLKTNTLEQVYDSDLLDKYGIRELERKKFNSYTPFILRKGDLKI